MVIETPRLFLRHMTAGDVPALLAVFGDAETMRYYPAAFDAARMQAWVDWNMRSYETHGHGLWAMSLRATGEVIGDCGLVCQQVEGVQEIEVGYHVRRDHWGQGLATEAASGCVNYGFTTIGCHRLVSLMNPQNMPSRHVAEKIGMTLRREVEWKNKPTCIYEIERRATQIPNRPPTMKIEGIKGCFEKTRDLFYFARMCSKIRLHAQGSLPAEYQRNARPGL